MRKLILTEKPSVAREIARILNCQKKDNGYLSNSEYIITWALGHLVTLATPEELNIEWSEWKLDMLPMIPKTFETRIIKQTSKQFNTVKYLMRQNDISELIIATDAGREGELVARWIINKVGFNKPLKRLWISSMTDSAIKDGLKNLKDAKEYNRLYDSAEARAIADWLVGLNITRALTCKYNAQLSAGRVQTPTLAMVINREEEIKKFTPKDYQRIFLSYKGIEFFYNPESGDDRFFDSQVALEFLKKLKNGQAFISLINEVDKEEVPPLLYDLGGIQQDANRLFGLSPKATLDIIQKLYESYKYLTYPRTDSKYLTNDIYHTIKDRIKNLTYDYYQPIVNEILNAPIKNHNRIFNNTKVSDHHAIIPTEERPIIGNLQINERKVYDLIVKRFLAAFLDNCKFKKSTIGITITVGGNKYQFIARGKKIINLGWRKVYQNTTMSLLSEEEDYNSLPEFRLNEIVTLNLNMKKGQTKAPDRYTEATLLNAMEHPGKFVESAKMKVVLEKASGIGTPATRADIMEKLFSSGYMMLRGKSIYPTDKGIQLIKLVPEMLKSPQLTAEWEERLMQISEGKAPKINFIKDMEQNTIMLVNQVKNTEQKYRHDNITNKKCPDCGKNLLEITNKNGKVLVCMDRCGYRQNVSRISMLRCPKCHKKMEEYTSKDNTYLQCSCGFKDNKQKFLDKYKERKGDMGKKELESFLRKQNKDVPTNNPFLDIFGTNRKQ